MHGVALSIHINIWYSLSYTSDTLFLYNWYAPISIIPNKKNTTDVLQAADQDNKFFFYEVYEDAAAIDFHKTQPHYAAWGTFKESGGTISSVSKKAAGKFMT